MEDKVVEWHEVEGDEEEGGGQGGRRDCRRGEEERKTKGDIGGGDKEQDRVGANKERWEGGGLQ